MRKILTAKTASGTVRAMSSKSCLHRALICAALCRGETKLFCTPPGEDVLATVGCLRALGAQVHEQEDGFTVRGGLTAKEAVLDCKKSGTTLRFLLPVAAALGVRAEFVCDAQLRRRPTEPLLAQLRAHGCKVSETETGYLCEGKLQGGDFFLPGDVSSQYLSGLLLALPLLVDDSRIMLTSKLCSASFVSLTRAVAAQFGVASVPVAGSSDDSRSFAALRMTQECGTKQDGASDDSRSFAALRMTQECGTKQDGASDDSRSFAALRMTQNNSEFLSFFVSGKQEYHSPQTVIAEGDWSNAAPFLCAGAFSEAGVTVTGLSAASKQGDRAIVSLLRMFGAEVSCSDDAVTVRRGCLHGCRIDASDIPDLVPLLALLGACAEGETVIFHIARLRGKETDRVKTTAQTLNALGARVTASEDALTVQGVPSLSGGTVDACSDHRIAMLAAVASLACTAPVTVEGAEAVSKSYPDFFDDFAKICR